MNINVLDTSAIIQDPMIIFSYPEGLVVIPDTVVEKLMYLEDDNVNKLRALTARTALKFIEEITTTASKEFQKKSNTENIMLLENGGLFQIYDTTKLEKVVNLISKKYATIISVAKALQADNTSENLIKCGHHLLNAQALQADTTSDKVAIITTDAALRITGSREGLTMLNYKSDVSVNSIYETHKGHKQVYIPSELLTKFYAPGERLTLDDMKEYVDITEIYPNTFLNLIDSSNPQNTALARVKDVHGKLCIMRLLIDENLLYFGIKHKDSRQLMALELLLDVDVQLVTLIGKSGTGKTLLALAAALHQTCDYSTYKRIMLLRSLTEVGDNPLGFLPGEKDEKLSPYMAPFYDNLEYLYENKKGVPVAAESILESLEGIVRLESTGHLRGRTLPNYFVICDEVQNLTPHEVKTLVTRLGEGGKLVLMGDPEQIDNRYLDIINNGLIYISEKMKPSKLSGTIYLDGKSQRSALVEEASKFLV